MRHQGTASFRDRLASAGGGPGKLDAPWQPQVEPAQLPLATTASTAATSRLGVNRLRSCHASRAGTPPAAATDL